jgi:hypothetical protein
VMAKREVSSFDKAMTILPAFLPKRLTQEDCRGRTSTGTIQLRKRICASRHSMMRIDSVPSAPRSAIPVIGLKHSQAQSCGLDNSRGRSGKWRGLCSIPHQREQTIELIGNAGAE